jgi:hypothetical protein
MNKDDEFIGKAIFYDVNGNVVNE